jgi:hypothetical protein
MLAFAYEYKRAINKITDIRDMKLRVYEIDAHEWEIVRQLRDLLKVSRVLLSFSYGIMSRSGSPFFSFLDIQGRHVVLLARWHIQHCLRNPCNGPS